MHNGMGKADETILVIFFTKYCVDQASPKGICYTAYYVVYLFRSNLHVLQLLNVTFLD